MITGLRGLSLWNPHAGLMAIGAKAVESRGRKIGVRNGPLAIASTVNTGRNAIDRGIIEDDMRDDPFAKVLRPEGWMQLDKMPRGSILALVFVTAEVATSELIREAIYRQYGPDELEFGWYVDGRVAIQTDRERLIRLPTPVIAQGAKQGLWKVPESPARAIIDQVGGHPAFKYYRSALEQSARGS